MLYYDFRGERLSRLGFGAMRLPQLADQSIDEARTREMVEYALSHGVNYFDTAWPYHGGLSETVIGRLLAEHPRDSFYLADKYPGHQTSLRYDPAATFEQQLQKCQVEYFDFYLLHNVCENSLPVYADHQWGIIDYFVQQKKLGRIRHLGFSTHARPETLQDILQRWGAEMEFCQIQLNYLDWSLQDAEAKYQLLGEYGLPIWVMEPLRGGKLASLSPEAMTQLRALRPHESAVGWAFRWLQGLEQVGVTLSGVSTLQQLQEDIAIFNEHKPLHEAEKQLCARLAAGMADALPCTGCGYCRETCPQGLDIPMLIKASNDARFATGFTVGMQMDALAKAQRPEACLSCGACRKICPQSIDIPRALRELSELLAQAPSWADICRQREAEQLKNMRQK